MTPEDRQIVDDYMNWGRIGVGVDRKYDLNDAGLVVQEMQKRGEWVYCWDLLFDTYDEFCINRKVYYRSSDFTAWLFNPDNFFNAFIAWRKSK